MCIQRPGFNVPGVVTAAVVNDTATRVGITDKALLKTEGNGSTAIARDGAFLCKFTDMWKGSF